MTKKSKDLDEGLAAEKTVKVGSVPLSAEALEASRAPDNAWTSLREIEATELLVALEQRCMDGGAANLDDIRAVLAKLREG